MPLSFPTRRGLLAGAGALALLPSLRSRAAEGDHHAPTGMGPVGGDGHQGKPSSGTQRLVIAPAEARLVGPDSPATSIWSYGGGTPGPVLRGRQGERLRVEVENRLPVATTVHWHGLRLPHAMDGVPGLTQDPIPAEGGRFTYEFDLKDAGTFWYHPHLGSAEAVGRGLAGALIVEEREPPAVDRDVTWLIQDWRLTRDARIADDFGRFHDAAHAGRIGNVVTLNGTTEERFPVRAGERLRLRLINAAPARIVALSFRGHAPQVVALDGHPVPPHAPPEDRVVLGPGMRADLILDCTGAPGETHAVVDSFYPRQGAYWLVNLAYGDEAPLPRDRWPAVGALPPNPVPEPDIAAARRVALLMEGGAMSPAMRRFARGDAPAAWGFNGAAGREHQGHHAHHPVIATVAQGESVVLEIVNDTRWHHPIHLHGHAFRILSRNGVAEPRPGWHDTALLGPRERTEIAFVAEGPGDWMVHCHVLEHQGAGMMGVLRVT